jgi:hypothetical protein
MTITVTTDPTSPATQEHLECCVRGVLVLIRSHNIPHTRKYLLAFVPPVSTRVNLHHFSSVCLLFPSLSLSLPLFSNLISFSGLMVRMIMIRVRVSSVRELIRVAIDLLTVVMTNRRVSMRTSLLNASFGFRAFTTHDRHLGVAQPRSASPSIVVRLFPAMTGSLCSAKDY